MVITDGKNPVHVRGEGRLYRIELPAQEVVNPIGCGDCFTAAVAWATGHGREPLNAVRYGVAAAADKLTRLLPGGIDPARVEAIAQAVVVKRL